MDAIATEGKQRHELAGMVQRVLRGKGSSLSLSDLWLELPNPRPGRIELERMLMVRDDVFQFTVEGFVELVDSGDSAPSMADRARDGQNFAKPSPRALMGYYESCVREDGCRVHCYSKCLGISALPTKTEWASEQKGVCSIPVIAENRDLILQAGDKAAAHYYGYPLLAQWQEEEQLMKFVPVLLWKLGRIGDDDTTSSRLSFTLDVSDFRFNQEVLAALPWRARKRTVEFFQNACGLIECLELISADFLGLLIQEKLYHGRIPQAPRLDQLGQRDEGIYNRGLYLSITPNSYVKGLATELSILAREFSDSLPPTSLSAFLDSAAVSPQSPPTVVVPVTRPLNAYQEVAVERALHHPLSVITGPPGTGKSEVVVAIIVNAILAGKSVLFATRNNAAISVVQERVDELIGSGRGMLRMGSTYDDETKRTIGHILDAPLQRTVAELRRGAEAYDEFKRDLDSVLESIDQYQELMDKATAAERRFFRALQVFNLDRRTTVPNIFTAADLAVIEQSIGHVQQSGRWRQLPIVGERIFRKRLQRWSATHDEALGRIATGLRIDRSRLVELALDDHQAWSRNALQLLELYEAAVRAVHTASSLEKLDGLETLFENLTVPQEELCAHTREKMGYLLNERTSAATQTQGFMQGARQFLDTIGRRQDSRLHLQHPMEHVLSAFPCWAVSNLSVGGRFPLMPGLFDYLVLDESSQCDIPSCIPLLFRAKQAVIIGDPMQLNSVTKLSAATEQSLLRQHGIPNPGVFRYSRNSIYDLAAASAPSSGRTFLAQHYRCHPDIIEFANSAHWYNSSLLAVTAVSQLRRPKDIALGVSWLDVKGDPQNDFTGFWIPAEVERIVAEVVRLLMDDGFEGTVGVVTPFRRMANALQDAVEASPVHHSTLTAAKFRADTAHRFQGDERDVIYYAPCFHPTMSIRHKRFLSSQKNVFNVALSRARSCFVVVGDKDSLRACGIDYLGEFVNFVEGDSAQDSRLPARSEPERGHWEPILEQRLREEGIPVKAQYPVGPFWLDFALFDGNRKLDIEVDGEQFHKNEAGMRCQKDIDRNIYVKAQGWVVMRFWVYQLRDDIDSCVQEINTWWTKQN